MFLEVKLVLISVGQELVEVVMLLLWVLESHLIG